MLDLLQLFSSTSLTGLQSFTWNHAKQMRMYKAERVLWKLISIGIFISYALPIFEINSTVFHPSLLNKIKKEYLQPLCMCVHQLIRRHGYVLQCVMIISKWSENFKPNLFKPITIAWWLTFTIFVKLCDPCLTFPMQSNYFYKHLNANNKWHNLPN